MAHGYIRSREELTVMRLQLELVNLGSNPGQCLD